MLHGANCGSPDASTPIPADQRRHAQNGGHSTDSRGVSTWVERTRERQNVASCTRTWPVTVVSAINAFRAVLMALVEAMCKFPAATSSDTDEEEFHQHIFNVDVVTSHRPSERHGRVLDLGRNWASGTELQSCNGLSLREPLLSFFAVSVHSAGQYAFPRQNDPLRPGSLARLTWPFSGDSAGLEADPYGSSGGVGTKCTRLNQQFSFLAPIPLI